MDSVALTASQERVEILRGMRDSLSAFWPEIADRTDIAIAVSSAIDDLNRALKLERTRRDTIWASDMAQKYGQPVTEATSAAAVKAEKPA